MKFKKWKIYRFIGEMKEILNMSITCFAKKIKSILIVFRQPGGTKVSGPGLWQKFRVIVGFMLIFCGLIGFLIPFVPGTALLLAGVALAGSGHPAIHYWIKRIKQWRKSFQATLSRFRETLCRTKA